jgi:hypothetical protein
VFLSFAGYANSLPNLAFAGYLVGKTVHQEEGVPLLGQEGWTRHQKMPRSLLWKARPGWSDAENIASRPTTPSALHKVLREIFLVAQPPLLSQEGNTLAS